MANGYRARMLTPFTVFSQFLFVGGVLTCLTRRSAAFASPLTRWRT